MIRGSLLLISSYFSVFLFFLHLLMDLFNEYKNHLLSKQSVLKLAKLNWNTYILNIIDCGCVYDVFEMHRHPFTVHRHSYNIYQNLHLASESLQHSLRNPTEPLPGCRRKIHSILTHYLCYTVLLFDRDFSLASGKHMTNTNVGRTNFPHSI